MSSQISPPDGGFCDPHEDVQDVGDGKHVEVEHHTEYFAHNSRMHHYQDFPQNIYGYQIQGIWRLINIRNKMKQSKTEDFYG